MYICTNMWSGLLPFWDSGAVRWYKLSHRQSIDSKSNRKSLPKSTIIFYWEFLDSHSHLEWARSWLNHLRDMVTFSTLASTIFGNENQIYRVRVKSCGASPNWSDRSYLVAKSFNPLVIYLPLWVSKLLSFFVVWNYSKYSKCFMTSMDEQKITS